MDVFFAISGFVITALLVSELVPTGGIVLRRFYARRVKRLAPALALMVVVIAVLGTVASPVGGQDVGARTGLFASVFASNVYLLRIPTGYFDPVATLNPFLHLWTLAVEEQFYVFFPTLLLVSWWLGRKRALRVGGRGCAAAAVALATAVSFALAFHFTRSVTGSHQQLAFYGSPTRAWEFGAGALVALAVPWLARMPRPAALVLGAVGLAGIGWGAFAMKDVGGYQVVDTLAPVLGTCALLAAGAAWQGGAARVLGLRPIVWVGDLSYSWYLWHWPLIVFAVALWPGAGWAAPGAAGLSLIPAWLSYRFVENPIRFSHAISGRRVLQLAAGCAAVSIVACAGLLGFRHVVARTDAFQDYGESQMPHPRSYSCPTNTQACAQGRPKGTVVLIGDSNAGMLGDPVLRAATRAGFAATLISSSACPFADVRVVRRNRPLPERESAACRRFYARNLQRVLRLRPRLVIAVARTDRYIDDTTFGLGAPDSSAVTYSATAKERIWIDGLESTLRKVAAAGIRVVVVQPVPVVQTVAVSGCAAVRILAGTCITSASRTSVDRYLAPAVEANDVAVAAVDHGVTTIDFRGALCSEARCRSQRGDVVLYLDRYHLSVAGSLLLTGAFDRIIRADTRNARA